MILRDKTFLRTLRHAPKGLLGAALATADAIEADWPNLPGAGDAEYPVPPTGFRWRRRVAGSSWWVVYSWTPETQTLIVRTVNDLG